MAINLSAAGISVNYAVEATAGTRPTTNYEKLIGIKETPELNPEPSTLDTTTLDETVYKTAIPGLKDLGGALSFLANLSQELYDQWEELMTEYEAADADGKAVWFAIIIPGIDDACFFTGVPSSLGMPAAQVDTVLEANLYITPTNAPTWETKPTVISA